MESSNAEEKLDSISRIALLEKAVQELGRPWYRHALTVITGLALLFSIASAVFTYMTKNTEDMRSKREELRGIIEKIIDLRYDSLDNPNLEHIVKQTIYIDAAESLIIEFPEKVSYQEYIVLAKEMYWRGYNKKAEYYGEKAINAAKNSKDILAENTALCVMAELSFYVGIQNFEKGRDYYHKATNLLNNTKDNYIKGILADNYKSWGLSEITNNFVKEGNEKIERARKYYADLNNVGIRMGAIYDMEKKIREAMLLSLPPPGIVDPGKKPLPRFDNSQKSNTKGNNKEGRK
jgi:tetratricopeptide (TPR) repeat protein